MQEQNKLSKTAPNDQIVPGISVRCARMIFLVALLCLVSEPVLAWGPKSCTQTSWAAFVACQNEARDDYWIARGNCYNLSDPEARAECFKDALSQFREAGEECKDQRAARLEVCEDIGEAPYDPMIDPANFVDPATISPSNANPYFPLVEGYEWVYEGGDETITVKVTDKTTGILGVKCRVVTDVVKVDGEVIEDTNDWYAQDVDGNVWYFGESSLATEDCNGCKGLVSTEGSWKAGVEYAKPGIIMWALPEYGKVYRQEFALGEAEDMGKVLSLAAEEEVDFASCEEGDNCLQTADYTPIEPDVVEHKFYKPGTGLILEVDPETEERVELTSFTTY
jgi:hypothetical protein